MALQYCSSCGNGVMPTMRLCPSCGNRSFGPTPPTAAAPAPVGVSTPPTTAGNWTGSTGGFSPAYRASPALKFQPAGHWRRLFAYLLDYVIVTLIAGVLSAVAGFIGVFDSSAKGALSGGVILLGAAVVPFVYFTIMHSRDSGATWGKSAMGLRVVTLGGERLTRTQAFIRVLLTLLVPIAGWIVVGVTAAGTMSSDVEALKGIGVATITIGVLAISFGPYLTVFFNPQRQTLFDLICKTCVINKN